MRLRKKISIILLLILFIIIFFGVANIVWYGKGDYRENVNPISYIYDTKYTDMLSLLDSMIYLSVFEKETRFGSDCNSNIISRNYANVLFDKTDGVDSLDVVIEYIYKPKLYKNLFNDCMVQGTDVIKIDSISTNKTKLTITPLRKNLFYGIKLGPSRYPSVIRAIFPLRMLPIGSTTIEEYEILLKIGKELGQKDMPEVVYP